MRRKILIGLCLAAIVGIAAGLLNHASNAQDKNEKKSDLFDTLKKALETKSEPTGLPPLPDIKAPPPASTDPDMVRVMPGQTTFAQLSQQYYGSEKYAEALLAYNRAHSEAILNGVALNQNPPRLEPGQQILKPTVTVLERDYPKMIPGTTSTVPTALTAAKDEKPLPGPPATNVPLPPPSNEPPFPPVQQIAQPPATSTTPPPIAPTPNAPPPNTPRVGSLPPAPVEPTVPPVPQITPPATQPFPQAPMPPIVAPKKGDNGIADLPTISPDPSPVPPIVERDAPTPKVPVRTRQSEGVLNPTNSPWSLRVDVVDGQTVVIATVGKKHEFKIVCQKLDLQTGASSLKASGKVTINGDALSGSCDRLAISLTDDRLILEGSAMLNIERSTATVSNDESKQAAFELKGETLNLRISELQAGKFLQTSWRKADADVASDKPAAAPTPTTTTGSKQWSPYGKLVKTGSNGYALIQSDGGTLQLVVSDAGTLEPYVGRTVSVFGPMVRNNTVRVTHIAAP